MRMLFTIPHYFDPQGRVPGGGQHGAMTSSIAERSTALASVIHSIHQLFGRSQAIMELQQRRTRPANETLRGEVCVVLCTAGGKHLLDSLPVNSAFFEHHETHAEPHLLGFECHHVLQQRFGQYDWYCYLEDDLILHDAWLFQKLQWFCDMSGPGNVLLPNRFERGTRPLVTKAYIDGDLSERATARWWRSEALAELHATVFGQAVLFRLARNPHSGCFFLNADQMGRWLTEPAFLDRDTAFIGPLESAATLGLLKTFAVYKPDRTCASYLEIEHSGSRFIDQLRRQDAAAQASDESVSGR